MAESVLLNINNVIEPQLLEFLTQQLGGALHLAQTAEQARDIIRRRTIKLFLCSLGVNTLEYAALLKAVKTISPDTVIILIVPQSSQAPINEILQIGAHFYLHVPCNNAEAAEIIQRAELHCKTLRATNPENQRPVIDFPGIIGKNPMMQQLFNTIRLLADDSDSTILIHGDSGTGKELVARAVHSNSPRKHNNFVPINCAAIPEELLESELFGHVKGSFTGATANKKGRLHHADGGTLFLDEIGDMKPLLQAKILRVIQEKEFEPVGSVKSVKIDVRIVAATHRNLEEAIKDGTFREDLYYRLNVVPLHIPALHQRRDDIALLLDTFTERFCHSKKRPVFSFAQSTIECLQQYPWPGNVRELENLVQRLSILHTGKIVFPDDLPEKYLHSSSDTTLNPDSKNGKTDFNIQVSEFEDRLILQALMKTGGNKKEAAQLLNLKRTTLLEKIKKKRLGKSHNK
ncbi:MAG: sigma-54 dependent transcriptional regulator [Desulfuromonadaceae bacterium]|nr:sigma-54 dependent transcriptional regulator [Desulfuromonas sp.]MDY0184971.1 sigma-54 dependent transcriptional regulator [Desulfuromonadaceae bacterium]